MRHPATDRVESAAEIIHRTLNPTDEVRGPREDIPAFVAETWAGVGRTLAQAEDALDTGVGGGDPDVGEGMRLVRLASDDFERTRGLMGNAPRDVGMAFADALRQMDGLTGRS